MRSFETTALCVLALVGCGTSAEPAREPARPAVVAPAAAHASLAASAAAPPADAASSAASARPSPSSAPTTSDETEKDAPAVAFTAAQVGAIDELVRTRRVFRHLVLGRMPIATRHTWMLDAEGRRLTVVCEHTDSLPPEKGRPDAIRWYVVASASFSASALPAGQTWSPTYRRDELITVGPRRRSACAELGEEITFTCREATLPMRPAGAHVPADNPPYGPKVWRPAALRNVSGLGCDFETAADRRNAPRRHNLGFYDYPYEVPSPDPRRPMVYFRGTGERTEGIVYSSGLQYVGFREGARPEPFDPKLPQHLFDPAH